MGTWSLLVLCNLPDMASVGGMFRVSCQLLRVLTVMCLPPPDVVCHSVHSLCRVTNTHCTSVCLFVTLTTAVGVLVFVLSQYGLLRLLLVMCLGSGVLLRRSAL